MVLVLPNRSNSCSCNTRKSFDLKFQRYLPHFIQEDGPAVGQLESPDLRRDGPGKCSLFVTEQLALQQPGGNRGTIEFHEGPLPSIAEIVQGPRDQLLPAARFTEYQHGRTGGRDGLNLL